MTKLFAVHLFALLVGGAVLTGCTHPPDAVQLHAPLTKPEGARLSTSEVIDIATQEATRRGIDLHRFKEPKASYEPSPEDGYWWVSFQGRAKAVGNFFSLRVDDRTGEIEFYPGY